VTNTDTFFSNRIKDGAILAPMAGFTDAPFRKLCREFGSTYAITEMVSAKALVSGLQRGIEIGAPYPGEPDLVIQIFAADPQLAAEAAIMLVDQYNPVAFDLNMGCPVKKIVNKGCGSDLMRNLNLASSIVRALVEAVNVPVSAKMRLGFDTVNVIEAATAVVAAGVSAVAVHGRTATQKYSGEANWDEISRVAEVVDVPVIGSGDIDNRERFEEQLDKGLGVMIARGSLGRPWIFGEIRGGESLTLEEVVRLAYRHARLNADWYGERRGIQMLRGQLGLYFASFPEGRVLKPHLVRVSSINDFVTLMRTELGTNPVHDVDPLVKS
jgi:tRNA-dihydrouridine synthase B